jgi:hypothetical protein
MSGFAQPSSTLVNVAEHAELTLVRLMAESAPKKKLSPKFEADCEACISNADAPALIRTILRDAGAMAALFVMDPVEDAISAFTILAALLDRVGADRPGEEAGLAAELAETVGNNKKFDAGKRIAMLCALYNLRTDGGEKCRLLARIVALSAESDPKMLASGHALGSILDADNISSLVSAWNTASVAEHRALLRTIADGVRKVGDEDSISRNQRFLLLLVETYADEVRPPPLYFVDFGILIVPFFSVFSDSFFFNHFFCISRKWIRLDLRQPRMQLWVPFEIRSS